MAAPPEHWEQIKGLFMAALEVEAGQRSSLLRERCTDEAMRAEVERLLAEHAQADTFMSTPILQPGFAPLSQAPYLDSYQMLELIGEGGMGEVWLAEQKEPVR